MPLMGLQKLQLHIARGPDHGHKHDKWESKCFLRRGVGLRTLHSKHGKSTESNSTQHKKQAELTHLQVKLPASEFYYLETS